MRDYETYKRRLEASRKKNLEELLYEQLVKEGKGPSVCARDLGVPRPVIIHYRKKYDLKQPT